MIDPSLSLLVLRSPRFDTVRRFYAALGVELREERHGTGPAHLAARVGPVVLEFYPSAEGKGPDGVRLGLTLADLSAALLALESIGVRPERGPASTEWGLRAVVRDPDGRAVELYQGVPDGA